jgi:hypothetical protein
MRKHFALEHWFCCQGCGHLFTDRAETDDRTQPEERLPEYRKLMQTVDWDD